jgi:hypothetical protein
VTSGLCEQLDSEQNRTLDDEDATSDNHPLLTGFSTLFSLSGVRTMMIRSFAAVLFCLIASTVYAEDIEVKEITVKGYVNGITPTLGKLKPTEIKTAAELEKAFSKKENVDSIKKEVDFEKQQLLFFSWSGRMDDKIAATSDKDEITFTLTKGKTGNNRSQQQMFVVPKDAKYKVETAK